MATKFKKFLKGKRKDDTEKQLSQFLEDNWTNEQLDEFKQDLEIETKKKRKLDSYVKDDIGKMFFEAKWNKIELDKNNFRGDLGDGFYALEELDPEEARKLLGESKQTTKKEVVASPQNNLDESKQDNKKKKKKNKKKVNKMEIDDAEKQKEEQSQITSEETSIEQGNASLPSWEPFDLHKTIIKSLSTLKFTEPTKIQSIALPHAIKSGKDIVGAAETGSGKTLAFGLPIIHRILTQMDNEQEDENLPTSYKNNTHLRALILTPTRELAIQIRDHLSVICKDTTVRVVGIVGGMSIQKQERLLKKRPQIVVSTPGRLWELIQASRPGDFLWDLSYLEFLVLDEADRMLDQGHFKDLREVLKTLPRHNPSKSDVSFDPTRKSKVKRQTFIFSATLMMMGSSSSSKKNLKKNNNNNEDGDLTDPAEIKDELVKLLDFQRKIEMIDLSRRELVAERLYQAKIVCLANEKDFYAYNFLHHYKGRTLVFVNAISCIRRLHPLLNLLNVPAWPLHANMQQRQRLKNLERFRSSEHGVLIATDVAARGLDIPSVQHVLHYQLPRSTDIYVHRSGRTARGQNPGIAVMLVSPEENQLYQKICEVQGIKSIPNFPIDTLVMKGVRERVAAARKIDKELHDLQKVKPTKFIKKAADALEIDDIDLMDEDMPHLIKRKSKEAEFMIRQLNELLGQPLAPKGTALKYMKMTSQLYKYLDEADDREAIDDLKEAGAELEQDQRPVKRQRTTAPVARKQKRNIKSNKRTAGKRRR